MCECCGGESVIQEEFGISEKPRRGSVETVKHTCLICGSDWITSKHESVDGDQKVVVHFLSFMEPRLRKTVEDATFLNYGINFAEHEGQEFDYYIGSKEVRKGVWYEHFIDRLSLIRAATLN